MGIFKSASHTLIWKLVPFTCRCKGAGVWPPLKLNIRSIRRLVCSVRWRIRALGQYNSRSRTICVWLSFWTNSKAHIPRLVVANRHSPKGEGWNPYSMWTPSPLRLNSPGVTASHVTKRSCNRPGLDRPASKVASNTLPERCSNFLAYSLVKYCRNRLGLIPTHRLKIRWKWNSLKLTLAAICSKEGWRWIFSSRYWMAASIRS